MPEILLRQEQDFREGPYLDGWNGQYSRVVLARTDWWRKTSPKGEPMLVRRDSSMNQGFNAYSGKRWTRWVTTNVRSIRAREDGPWEVRAWSKNAGGSGWNTSLIFRSSMLIPYFVPRDVDSGLPDPINRSEYYPLAEHYERRLGTAEAPSEVRRALVKTDDVAEVTRRLFGKTRYRRDLVRAVAQANLHGLTTGWMFRGLCPIDWIIPVIDEARAGMLNIRPVLRRLDQRSLWNLLHDQVNFWQVRDIRSFWLSTQLAPFRLSDEQIPRMRTWRELHDWLMNKFHENTGLIRIVNRQAQVVNLPAMEMSDFAESLSGMVGDLEVKIADHENTLREWGDYMSNCIGSYGHDMRSGRAILGGVYRGVELVANFEIQHSLRLSAPNEYTLSQLLGRFNRSLPDDIRVTLEDHLRLKGVNVQDYWGNPIGFNAPAVEPMYEQVNYQAIF